MSQPSGNVNEDAEDDEDKEEKRLFGALATVQNRLQDNKLNVLVVSLRALFNRTREKYVEERKTSLLRQDLFCGAMNELLLVLGKLNPRQLIEECEKAIFCNYPGHSTSCPERTGRFGESTCNFRSIDPLIESLKV
jgi:hypothetical protein